ncbi:hypothetical protein [Novipirellula sp.]|uniref:hypothetical protein n=1 Tax=Novipirellula sp. TaxID=2795430 RepID=UPI003568A92C
MDASQTQLPPPTNWQDFEFLCHLLWRDIWQDPAAKKNGRSGQKDFGVDVYGCPQGGSEYAGVQCKGKENIADKNLTEKQLRDEIKKSEEFEPKLTSFILATSGQRDAKLQKVARSIDQERKKKGLFSVDIFFWEDIREALGLRVHLCKQLYPQFFSEETPFRPATKWNLDYFQNPSFTGRINELAELRRALEGDRRAAVTQAIHGQGGVGKTQLAIEYA